MNPSSYTAINGNRTLADALGVSPSLISQWKTGYRRISPETAVRIERATNGAITRSDLRPDIFGPLDATPGTGPIEPAQSPLYRRNHDHE
ncbi:helix-turn-helix domain-containing protein [Acidithiobacillus caldus]|uniref:transcriptional regulator n=1 Tax=Acidithiobacillus caldus TaxID=33059 RepID=UPI001C068183|nr:Cro/CI family transcriptional regulator [Acidithiobacillus caldus]MBU2800717.1 helix-turn-helix domain-containing protein [Acidithiobacillus caldus]